MNKPLTVQDAPRFKAKAAIMALLFGLCWTSTAMADTVINIPGPTIGFADFGDAALADSWTQDFSVTDGSISVDVQGLEPSGGTIHFYLTTAIGPTATLSDLVAFTSIDVPFELTSVTPFSNLNLAPGTYYLVLADYTANNNSVDGPDWNYFSGESGIETAPGVTVNPAEEAFSLGPFAPASSFQDLSIDIRGVMSVTGTIVPETTPTPEPSSVLLIAGMLLAFGVARVKKIGVKG